MTKNHIKILVITLIASLFLTQCGINGKDSSGEKLSQQSIHICMIGTALHDPVSQKAFLGAENEIEKITRKYSKLKIILDYKAPEKESPEKQQVFIQEALSNHIDAIILSCSDSAALNKSIHQAIEAGVPVITYDSDAPSSKRIAYVGPDHYSLGEKLVGLMAPWVDSGQIAILSGNKKAYKHTLQLAGIQNALNMHPGLEIADIIEHDETPESAVRALHKALESHPDISGVITLGSWLFDRHTLMENQTMSGLTFVSIDAFPASFPYIENNILTAAVGQATFQMGSQALKLAVDKLYLNKDIDELNIMKVIPVSIHNLGGWARQLRAWGQIGIDEKYLTM
jgi:ribose transport system substrate-binding protein